MARLEWGFGGASEQGLLAGGADGLFELGLLYSSGREVPADMVTAHKWFNLAALRGNEAAKQYRMDLAREMTKAQIAAAQKLAREWLSSH